MIRKPSTLFLTLTVALAAVAGTATAAGQPEVTIDSPGKYTVRAKGPTIEVVTNYQFANREAGQEWMLLGLAMTGATRNSVTITRNDIHLVAPDGSTVPLPEDQEVIAAKATLRRLASQALRIGFPLDYFRSGRQRCITGYGDRPMIATMFRSVEINNSRVCYGFFVFKVPKGISQGHWKLVMNAGGTTYAMPFEVTGNPKK